MKMQCVQMKRLWSFVAMLVEADPTVREDLAWSLYNLGVYLSKLGRYEDAVRADEEAVELRHTLVETDPTIRKDFAWSLHNLGNNLSNLGCYEDAVHADEEALEVRRKLMETDPTIRKDLAPSLVNLGVHLSNLGRYKDAVHADEEAVELYRKLSETDPTIRKKLADSLYGLGIYLSNLGCYEDAVLADEEAVELYRKLSETDPTIRKDLADCLHEIWVAMKHALCADEEVVNLRRKLVEMDPNFSAPMGHQEAAIVAGEEAVDICSKLPRPNVESELSLANRLKQLATYLDAVDRHEDALRSRDMRTLGREDDAVRIDAEVATLKNRLEEGQGPITGAVESSRLLVIPEIAGEGAETGGASEVDQGNNEGTLSEPPVSEEVQFAWWSEKYDRKLIAHRKRKTVTSESIVNHQGRGRGELVELEGILPEAAAGMGTGAGMSLKTLTSPGAKSRRRLPRPSRMQAVWVSDGEDEDDATVTSDNGEPKEDDADEEDADARAIAVPSLEGLDDLDGAPETERVVASRRRGACPTSYVSMASKIHAADAYISPAATGVRAYRFGNNAAATAGADADADAVGGKVADYAALPVAGAEVPTRGRYNSPTLCWALIIAWFLIGPPTCKISGAVYTQVSGSVFGSSLATENAAPIFTSMGSPALLVYASDIPRILADCITGHLISCCGPALDLASQTTVAAHYRICPVPRARDCPVW
ncbi:hypothetical protein B0H11DRAFT_2211619 [Mycena galericulata]|nr:hypothetical protein B0H11DRAFT_2211619 [Mycena galericulata]